MEKIKKFFAGKQLVYRRSTNLTKIMVITALALSMVALMALRLSTDNVRADVADLRRQAAALEQDNRDLMKDIGNLGSVQSVIKIAQAELGLASPDAVAFQPEP